MNFVCQQCKQAKATVHVTDTFPEKRERHLCEDCAAKENLIVTQKHVPTHEILKEFIKQKSGFSEAADVTCPNCGISFQEFQLKGQLGCPEDYTVFAEFLDPLIERAHEGATHHVGKVPPKADESIHTHTKLLRLRGELQDAIDREQYERAAQLRDDISAMESQ